MEPRIQYAQTEDGVHIAFSTVGKGMPLVQVFTVQSHLRQQWAVPEFRDWYEQWAQKLMLVQYDNRGTGLSQRDVTDFSMEALELDLAAVVDCLGLERFTLFGGGISGPVALAYAARHPERVSRLLLWCAYTRGSDMRSSPQARALGRLRDNWELYTDTLAHYAFGWHGGQAARQWGATIRDGISEENLRAFATELRGVDVSDLLPQITAPTLVLHRREYEMASIDIATDLASRIPGARLAVIEGSSGGYALENAQVVMDTIEEFLQEGEEAADARLLPEGTAIILFADIADSTALTEKLGDATFRARASQLDAALRASIHETGGTPVEGKVLGDGVMAVFTAAHQAIACALACEARGKEAGLQLHLGVHAGDVIREGNNVFGGAVNIAARIAGASAPGEILVSDTVRSLARTSTDVHFQDRGEQELAGVTEPQRLFSVKQQGGH